jgi:hypothetical protein
MVPYGPKAVRIPLRAIRPDPLRGAVFHVKRWSERASHEPGDGGAGTAAGPVLPDHRRPGSAGRAVARYSGA